MQKEKTGIIFDIDGTLWDSSERVAESYNDVIERHPGVECVCTAERIKSLMGKSMTEIAELLFPALDDERRSSIMKECEDHEIEYLIKNPPKAFPGVEDTLRLLAKRYPLFIVSNCQSGYIEAFLSITGLKDVILDHISFGDNKMPKGDNIRLIAERNGLKRYFYLGDIQSDYDATISGGGEFIHAAYGFGSINQEVPRINDISELPKLFDLTNSKDL